MNLRCGATLIFGLGQLDLDAVDAVHAVDEQDQDEDECDLRFVLASCYSSRHNVYCTFSQYCSFAMMGFSEMKVKTARLVLNGSGMMRVTKTAISNTRSAKTCE